MNLAAVGRGEESRAAGTEYPDSGVVFSAPSGMPVSQGRYPGAAVVTGDRLQDGHDELGSGGSVVREAGQRQNLA